MSKISGRKSICDEILLNRKIMNDNTELAGFSQMSMRAGVSVGIKFGAALFYLIFIMNKKQGKILDYNSSYR